MRNSGKLFLLLVVGLVALIVALVLYEGPLASEGVSPLMVAEPNGVPSREVRVLFVGTSYTYYYNMPKMFVEIAKSDPENNTKYVVQSVTKGGYGFSDIIAEGKAIPIIQKGGWNYVVIQDTAGIGVATGKYRDEQKQRAATLDREIKKISAETLLFANWALHPSNSWYKQSEFQSMSPQTMLFRTNTYINELAVSLPATPVFVGSVWEKALAARPGIPLYESDGTHPTATGSYLNALVFYKKLSGSSLTKVTYKPSGVARENAEFLKQLISQ